MKSPKTILGIAALALAATLCLTLVGGSAKASGPECGPCGGPRNTVSGHGTGSDCSQALDNAYDDAVLKAHQGGPSCAPCQLSNGPLACYAIDSWPQPGGYGATWTLYYHCQSCDPGGPSVP